MIRTDRRLGKAPISALAHNCSLSDRYEFRIIYQLCCTYWFLYYPSLWNPWVFFVLLMFKVQHWYKSSEARNSTMALLVSLMPCLLLCSQTQGKQELNLLSWYKQARGKCCFSYLKLTGRFCLFVCLFLYKSSPAEWSRLVKAVSGLKMGVFIPQAERSGEAVAEAWERHL